MKNNWNLVRKFGITDTKVYLCRSVLQDTANILNACYACDYDAAVAAQHNETHLCKYCPIWIERCDYIYSILFQMSYALQRNDHISYEKLCWEMAHAPIKAGINYDE